MYTVSRVLTHDGVIHLNQDEATRYLEKMYADVLCKVARDMVDLKYTARCAFIDEHLSIFTRLQRIKSDIICHPIQTDSEQDTNDW